MIKIFWSLNTLENQLLDQIYSILKNDSDITISMFPQYINQTEFKLHPLSKMSRFILINKNKIENNNMYTIKFIFHLLLNRYDLIDTKMAQSRESYCVYVLSKIFKFKYIVNLYGKERDILDKNKKYSKKIKDKIISVLKGSCFNICNDKTLLEVSNYVCKPNYLLYNAINTNRFFSIKKESSEKCVIFFNHRIIPDKRPKIFFEAVNILKNKNCFFKVIVVGPKKLSSSLGSEIDCYIRENELFNFIEWIDRRIDGIEMDKLYAKSDVTVNMCTIIVPSLATLEAMGSRIAPIIADGVDSDKYVQDGFNGFVIEPSSVLLAQKLQLLIENSKLREEFGKKSQEIVMDNFDISKWGEIYCKIYRHVLFRQELPKPFFEYKN